MKMIISVVKTIVHSHSAEMAFIQQVALALVMIVFIISFNSPVGASCGAKFGCNKEYCWAQCYGLLGFAGSEWCYTSESSSTLSYQYVTCRTDFDCDPCWRCGGPCTL